MQHLRSDIWCSAFVRRQNNIGNFCVVSRRGDAVAGQIWIEIDHLDGTVSLLTPAPGVERQTADRVFEKRFDRADPQTVKHRIAREIAFDPDLWLLALDSRNGEIGIDLA